jgi:hypothetical protein
MVCKSVHYYLGHTHKKLYTTLHDAIFGVPSKGSCVPTQQGTDTGYQVLVLVPGMVPLPVLVGRHTYLVSRVQLI